MAKLAQVQAKRKRSNWYSKKPKQYSTEKAICILKELNQLCLLGMTQENALVCLGINERMYYRWRERFGWMTSDEYDEMRKLQAENIRLKSLIDLWSLQNNGSYQSLEQMVR